MLASDLPSWITNTTEWRLIRDYYKDRVAERSRVPLINHIAEGAYIMSNLTTDTNAICAYLIHPLFQSTPNFLHHFHILNSTLLGRKTVLYVVEYRRAANAYLCRPHTDRWDLETISKQVGPLPEGSPLHSMLVADKFQNQKDFEQYHQGTHARSEQLTKYFNNWRQLLDPENKIWECPFLCSLKAGDKKPC